MVWGVTSNYIMTTIEVGQEGREIFFPRLRFEKGPIMKAIVDVYD